MSVRTPLGRRISFVLALLAALLVMPATLFAQEAPKPAAASGVLVPLYVSFAALQALDVHSTTRALGRGGVEANPLMQRVAGQPAALIAVKAGSTATTIFLAHKMSKRSRVGAIALMAAVNSAYAMLVAHNYRVAR